MTVAWNFKRLAQEGTSFFLHLPPLIKRAGWGPLERSGRSELSFVGRSLRHLPCLQLLDEGLDAIPQAL
jgi:hypothetical protein